MTSFVCFLLTIALINSINAVNSLAMSADGKVIVIGSYLGTLSTFHDNADGIWSYTSDIYKRTIRSVAISLPNEVKVVGFENNRIGVIKDGMVMPYNYGCNGREMTMSANGKYIVAGTAEGAFEIFEFDEKSILRGVIKLPNNYQSPVRNINITDDGQEVRICFADGEIIIYQYVKPTWRCYELATWSPDRSKMWITSIASTPDGRLFVGGTAEGKVEVWVKNAQNRLNKLTSLMVGKPCSICSLAVNQSGTRIISGTLDGEVQLWQSTSLNSWQRIGTLPSSKIEHATVAMSADGERIVRGVGGSIEVWQSEQNNSWSCIFTAKGLED